MLASPSPEKACGILGLVSKEATLTVWTTRCWGPGLGTSSGRTTSRKAGSTPVRVLPQLQLLSCLALAILASLEPKPEGPMLVHKPIKAAPGSNLGTFSEFRTDPTGPARFNLQVKPAGRLAGTRQPRCLCLLTAGSRRVASTRDKLTWSSPDPR